MLKNGRNRFGIRVGVAKKNVIFLLVYALLNIYVYLYLFEFYANYSYIITGTIE